MSGSADFTTVPASATTSVYNPADNGESFGSLAAEVEIGGMTAHILLQASGRDLGGASVGMQATGLYGAAWRTIQGVQGQRVLLLNESWEPLANTDVVAYDVASGAILDTLATDKHGVAGFIANDNLDWNTKVIGFKPRQTRGAGKFAEASNNGIVNLQPLASSFQDIFNTIEADPPTLEEDISINGSTETIIDFDLSGLSDEQRQGRWHVWTAFSMQTLVPD